jgi:hypothetical protein
MESFSLSSYGETKEYDNQVVPLLRRMPYLEELTLRLTVNNRSTFIDSTQLNNEILIYMPRLQTFTFNIVTFTSVISEANRQITDGVQHTFYNENSHQLVFYIDHYPRKKARSHIFSIPYILNDLLDISSNFPGGSFTSVRDVSLMDLHCGFEHDFFVHIARCFPLLTRLYILNLVPQKRKRAHQSNKNDQTSMIVEFPHLTNLTIFQGCIDYTEQFLVDTNTRLPRLIELKVCYKQLAIVTENFTRDATRHNCANIERLIFDKSMGHSKEFYRYFPCCK